MGHGAPSFGFFFGYGGLLWVSDFGCLLRVSGFRLLGSWVSGLGDQAFGFQSPSSPLPLMIQILHQPYSGIYHNSWSLGSLR